jgi:NADPH-dependent 2,4-dienoyl-CoA reductase/sulfur reductase-like enzyme/rhodanese-related sulfurtransferase
MKVVIIGGVAGGASAAARARRLSEEAEIIILERDEYVSFANCGLPYHIGGDIKERAALLLQTPESLKTSLNLDVRTGHEVLTIDRANKWVTVCNRASGNEYQESYDKLVLCQGANPVRPPLPGIDHPRLFTLRNIPDMDAIKAVVDQGAQSAVVIGGGYIGVEIAEALRQRGLQVDLVEMLTQVVPPLDAEMARDLAYHMESHGVTLHLGITAQSFEDVTGRIQVKLSDGVTLVSDLAIMAVGVRPASNLAREAGLELGPRGGIKVDPHQRTSDPDIYAAGDMVEVTDTVTGEPAVIPLAGPANRQGRIVADHIFGRASAYQSTQGTAILKVFEMTGGCTGASEKTLRRANIPFQKIYIHPSGHAGYYPGTAPMHLKLLFAPDSGRILGAQVVGYDGVDKRLDVFATAIRAGMTVYDLEHLELAYAPPYGSAKDPINMAGFVASNLLRGDVNFWYAEEYPEKTAHGTIIDVRSEEEYAAWHMPEAINIPVGVLRSRVENLLGNGDRNQPIFLYCRVGFRSYLAYRILSQAGYTNLATLAGGSKTFTCFHRTPLATGRPGVPFIAHEEEKMAAQPGALAHA